MFTIRHHISIVIPIYQYHVYIVHSQAFENTSTRDVKTEWKGDILNLSTFAQVVGGSDRFRARFRR